MRQTRWVVLGLLTLGIGLTVPVAIGTAKSPQAIGAAKGPVLQPDDFDYQQIDFVDSQGLGAARTQVFRMNVLGEVVGTWYAAQKGGYPHGFVFKDNKFTSIDIPGAAATLAYGINTHGHIVGTYTDPVDGTGTGFLLADGQISPITIENGSDVWVYDINDSDVVLGNYTNSDGEVVNFLWKAGRYTPDGNADITDSTFTISDSAWAEGMGLNNRGDVVGHFAEATDPTAVPGYVGTGHMYGFVYRNGTFEKVDWPGTNDTMSCLQGIGDQTDAVGHVRILEGSYIVYGTVWRDGRYVAKLRVPNAVNTYAQSMTANGAIAGYFAVVPGSPHGFIATRKRPNQ